MQAVTISASEISDHLMSLEDSGVQGFEIMFRGSMLDYEECSEDAAAFAAFIGFSAARVSIVRGREICIANVEGVC